MADHPLVSPACYRPARVKGLLVFGVCVVSLLVAPGASAGVVPRDDQLAPPAMELHDGRNPLAAHTSVLEDDAGTLTIDDVRGLDEHRFRPLGPEGENAGYTESTYWLRFRVKNTTASSSFIV